MKKAILATKVGMTQIFDENGNLIPVTVLQAGPCAVTQVKTVENDGYSAVQVGFVDKKEKIVNKDKSGRKEVTTDMAQTRLRKATLTRQVYPARDMSESSALKMHRIIHWAAKSKLISLRMATE